MRKKILVVDNSPVILRLLSHHLERQGHGVETAENGLCALELLETYRPDFIFTDLIMPKISGDTLCRIIRSRAEFDRVVLVILSGVAVEEEVDFAGLGADACIAKGSAREMVKHITWVIAHCRAGEPLPPGEILGRNEFVHREITSELLVTKRHFELTLEHMTDGFIEMTSSARIIYANSTAAALFRRTKEEVISSSFFSHFDPGPRQRLLSCVENLGREMAEIGEDEPVDLNGLYVLVKFIPVEEEGQQTIIVLVRDISRRKRAEQRLRDHLASLEETVARRTGELAFVAQQLKTTFDMIPDFIAVHDAEMRYIRVNRALAEAADTTPEELIGRHCYQVMHNRSSPPPSCPHVLARERGEAVSGEIYEFLGAKPMLVTCTPCFSEDGCFVGTVHIARDISAQKAAEAEREKLIDRLQQALSRVKLLSGIIPICASCKNIRDDKGYWSQVESYIRDHSEAEFSHSICPDCAERLYPGLITKNSQK